MFRSSIHDFLRNSVKKRRIRMQLKMRMLAALALVVITASSAAHAASRRHGTMRRTYHSYLYSRSSRHRSSGGRTYRAQPRVRWGFGRTMVATWYGTGRRRADGRRFNPKDPTICAHKTLPLGTKLLLSYRGRHLVCTVCDRGPYIRGRSLDLSRAGARVLGFIRQGVARLEVLVLS